jgi:TolB protein
MKKIITAAMIGVISITALTGCGVQNTTDREVIQKDGKQIVVIDDKQGAKTDEIALDKILSFEDKRVMDWISEDTILIMRENKNMPKYQAEAGMVYPMNFYEFNINTKEEKLAAESKLNMSNGILSPDKKHIFYKEGIENNLTGFILNRETGKKLQVTSLDSISSYEGQWVDNDTVILSSFSDGKITLVDVDGKKSELGKSPTRMIANTCKIGDKIYYTSMDGKFYVQDLDGRNMMMLMEHVEWIIPSPDRTKFAMVKRTEKTERALYITDLEGKELLELSRAMQIYGVNWSTDQSRVAFTTMEPNNNSGGLFVADTATGQVVQLSVDIHDAADPLRFSPSGKQVSVTTMVFGENSPRFITSLLKLK